MKPFNWRPLIRVVLFAALVVAGCGDGPLPPPPPPEPPPSAIGRWTLSEIGNEPLPYPVPSEPCAVAAGTLTIRADASFTLALTLACGPLTVGGNARGTWVQDGTVATFTPEDGCAETAVVETRALRIARSCEFDVPVVFTR
ncbi:MAG: hypothetical protein OXJ54_07360 [Gemmatimonadetes bacterium]|nr:hypothetical protein [Candidatus Palauibacter rhopaloidicola]